MIEIRPDPTQISSNSDEIRVGIRSKTTGSAGRIDSPGYKPKRKKLCEQVKILSDQLTIIQKSMEKKS
jgi:hypothetical protein